MEKKPAAFGIQGLPPAHNLVHHRRCAPEVGKVQGTDSASLRYSIILYQNTAACSDIPSDLSAIQEVLLLLYSACLLS